MVPFSGTSMSAMSAHGGVDIVCSLVCRSPMQCAAVPSPSSLEASGSSQPSTPHSPPHLSSAKSTAMTGSTATVVAPSTVGIATSGATIYKTWLARGLLHAASDVSRDLLSVVLHAAVQEAAAADSRGMKSSALSSPKLNSFEPLPPTQRDELLDLGREKNGDSVFDNATVACAALYRYPLDHDLMAALKIDSAKTAELIAQEAFDSAATPFRNEKRRISDVLEVSASLLADCEGLRAFSAHSPKLQC
jgi:hypothetical protein